MDRTKNIAFLGTRGIPPNYGGLETAIYNLIKHMTPYGIGAYVACESSYKRIAMSNVQQIFFPVSKTFRIFSEAVYDIVFLLLFTFKTDTKYIYLLAYPAGIFCIIPKLFGKIVAVNVDGLEWKRRKFSKPFQMLLKINEMMVHKTANIVVYDSKAIQKYHEDHYSHSNGVYLPYMVDINTEDDASKLDKYSLKPFDYYLVIARLEPENNIAEIVEGFIHSNSEKKLVVCGKFTSQKYEKFAKRHLIPTDNVVFLGFVTGQDQLALRKFCYAYIHGHEVGGTNPSLLEAIASGNAVIAKDVAYNHEVIGDGAIYFDLVDDITRSIDYLDLHETDRKLLGIKAFVKYLNYSPNVVTQAHLRVFQ